MAAKLLWSIIRLAAKAPCRRPPVSFTLGIMADTSTRTTCSTCDSPVDTSLDTAVARASCPACGGVLRTHDVILHAVAEPARVGLEVKARTPGKKKPRVEFKTGPSHSHFLQKTVEHKRLIDRGADVYIEEVTDYESGERIHETREPLSQHVNHGSAKPKR